MFPRQFRLRHFSSLPTCYNERKGLESSIIMIERVLPVKRASLSPSKASIVAEILREQCAELFQVDLFNEFEKSLTMLVLLRTQQQQFEYVPLNMV